MKHLTLTLKSSDLQDTGQFEGYASTFGNVDQGGDLIEPGAFRESVAKARAEGWGRWTCNGFVPVTYLIMPPWPRMRAG